MSATKTQVSDLHGLLCETLTSEIHNDPSPSLLNVARQFLKDCNVTVDSEKIPKTVSDLETAFDEHYQSDMPDFN